MSDSAELCRQRMFQGRAATLLKQTRELSTLCDSPACIVIYNPDDPVKPWRFWPENEADFRSVVQLYKNQPKNKNRPTPVPKKQNKGKAKAEIDDGATVVPLLAAAAAQDLGLEGKEQSLAGMSLLEEEQGTKLADAEFDSDSNLNPTFDGVCGWDRCELTDVDGFLNSFDGEKEDGNATSSSTPTSTIIAADSTTTLLEEEQGTANAGVSSNFNSIDGLCEWDECELLDVDELLKQIEDEKEEDGNAAAKTSTDAAVALMTMPAQAQPSVVVTESNNENAEDYSFVASADDVIPTCFDGMWWADEGESFDLEEFFNSFPAITNEHCLLNDTCESNAIQPQQPTESAAFKESAKEATVVTTCLVPMSIPARPAVVGSKRKAGEQVYSFSELASPSPLRRKITA